MASVQTQDTQVGVRYCASKHRYAQCTDRQECKHSDTWKVDRNGMIGTGEHKRQSLTNSAHRRPPDSEWPPIPTSPPRGTLVRYQGCRAFLITSACVDIKDIPRLSVYRCSFCLFSPLFRPSSCHPGSTECIGSTDTARQCRETDQLIQ